MADLEVRLHASALRQCGDADAFLQQWSTLPDRLKHNTQILQAFAARADALALETKAVQVLSDHLGQFWTAELLDSLASISSHANDQRIGLCEAWLSQHPDDAALHAALGKLHGLEKNYSKAETLLNRAVTLGPNSQSWEMEPDGRYRRRVSRAARHCAQDTLLAEYSRSAL